MASNLTKSFDVVMDEDEWMKAAGVFTGYLAPRVVQNVTEDSLPFDAPNELYGVATMVGAQYAPAYSKSLALGGGVYTVDQLAQRAGLKSSVTEIGN